MSRPRSQTREALVASAMRQFWINGFHATSMEDLVRATKVGRGGIYSDFGGKRELFVACLEHYQDAVVTPAFAQVEAEGAGLDAIAGYFEHQLAKADESSLPGPGCLVANTMTEVGPHDAEVLALVRAHTARLRAGFLKALANENASTGALSDAELDELAEYLATSAQGFWAFSRSVTELASLRRFVRTLIGLVRARLRA